MFNFTRQEQLIIVFLIASSLVGSLIVLYKRHHQSFAPELRLGPDSASSFVEAVEGSGKAPNEEEGLTGIIDVNTATVYQLQRLPRIGPVMAARIVKYRRNNGLFKSVEELMKVRGIGPKTLKRLEPYVRVK